MTFLVAQKANISVRWSRHLWYIVVTMKTFLFVSAIILSSSLSLASQFYCKTEEAAIVSVDGDFDQMTFKGTLDPLGNPVNVTVHYERLVRRNLYPNTCQYNLRITSLKEGSVDLFCPGEVSEHEYISTSKLTCEVRN